MNGCWEKRETVWNRSQEGKIYYQVLFRGIVVMTSVFKDISWKELAIL